MQDIADVYFNVEITRHVQLQFNAEIKSCACISVLKSCTARGQDATAASAAAHKNALPANLMWDHNNNDNDNDHINNDNDNNDDNSNNDNDTSINNSNTTTNNNDDNNTQY